MPFLACILAYALQGRLSSGAVYVAGGVAALLFLVTLLLFPQVSAGDALIYRIEWIPQLGLNLTLRMDGLAWLFCVLITLIGLLVVLYARYYMSPQDPVPRFFSVLMAFMGAMLGTVLSRASLP